MKGGRFFVKTFGCQMNLADSERIRRIFIEKGYQQTKDIKEADLVIINSCIVRQSAENRVYGLINNMRKLKIENLQIILTGCLTGWALQNKNNLNILRDRIGQSAQIIPIKDLADFQVEAIRSKKDHALIPISNGCSHFCSYSIVPYSRGKEKSRPFAEIIQEIKKLISFGYSKFTLLGQNVNAYQYNFPKLLKTIAEIPGVKFIDFMSSNPWDFSDKLIRVIADHKNITKTIHLPVQSGDDEVLKKMNRPYTAKQYLTLVAKIRKAIPKAKFTTDIIVGFPGETKKQFTNTVKLCKKVGFVKAYLNRYSPRPGTAAAKLIDNVPPSEKKRRWRKLEKLINSKTD